MYSTLLLLLLQDTFEMVKLPPKHPRNPNLTPVEVLPVLPDFDKWADKFVSVHFDVHPGEGCWARM